MRILSLIRWGVVAALLALLIAPATVALLTGTQLVVVNGKSMSPTYDFGDIVLIGPARESDFAPDHVVTVGRPNGEMYTHRIISISDGKAQLKGDGNAVEDPDTVTFDQLVGAVRGHIGSPLADVLAYAQSFPARISLAVFVLALVLLPLGSRRGSPRDQDDEHTPSIAHSPTDDTSALSTDDDLSIFTPADSDASTPHDSGDIGVRASRRNLQQW